MIPSRIALLSLLAALVAAGCASPPATPQQASPLSAEALYRLGRYLHGQQRLDGALAAYREALAAQPGHVPALNAAGTAHAQLGQSSQAEAAFRAAIAHDPASAQSHNNLGYHLLLAGRSAEALPLLERAAALAPADEQVRVNLAQARIAAQPAPVAAAAPEPAADPQATLQLAQTGPATWELRNAPAPASVVSAPPALRSALRVEVSNGNGATGLARRVATLLGFGPAQRRLTNDKPYGVRDSRIEHLAAAEPDARALQQRLPITVPLAAVPALERGAGVRLVLGKDFSLKEQP